MAKPNPKRLSQASTNSGMEYCLDFDFKDEMKTKEVDEIRARMCHMEKSLRWWNDCASNWRLKWTEVRNEKNKLKEECKSLKGQLEVVSTECEMHKSRAEELQCEVDKLRAENQHSLEIDEKFLNDDDEDMSDLMQRMETMEFELNEARTQCFALKQEKEDLAFLLEGIHAKPRSNCDASTSTAELEIPSLRENISSKEQDLKQAHNQLKKVLEEKCTELTTALRRNDLYENEIKKLRTKSEELRKELALAESEVDNASNTIRKLQRTNGKLQNEFDVHLRHCDQNKSIDFNNIEY